MSTEHLLIATAHPEFAGAAIAELQRLDERLLAVETLAPGILLCSVPEESQLMQQAAQRRTQLIFTRHLAPVASMVQLRNEEQDIGTIAIAIADLPGFALLERGVRFAVQSRFIQTEGSKDERPYSSGQLNRLLAEAIAEETGAVESIKRPQVVISLLCAGQKGYLGISPVEENLSSWPGGARRFAQTPEQLSRAEFKLLEALETFDVQLPAGGRGLDLGAAPGGWTRLLLEAGMHVVAVDPASLDPRVEQHRNLEHYRGRAESYLERAIHRRYTFDVIVSDMRMDAREAAHVLVKAAPCLRADGVIIGVLKLPHEAPGIRPLGIMREALDILKARYSIVQARQLFHNRQEITLVAAQPFRGGGRTSAIQGGRHVH